MYVFGDDEWYFGPDVALYYGPQAQYRFHTAIGLELKRNWMGIIELVGLESGLWISGPVQLIWAANSYSNGPSILTGHRTWACDGFILLNLCKINSLSIHILFMMKFNYSIKQIEKWFRAKAFVKNSTRIILYIKLNKTLTIIVYVGNLRLNNNFFILEIIFLCCIVSVLVHLNWQVTAHK